MTAEDDEATGRLLVAAALHHGAQHTEATAEAAQTLLDIWEQTDQLEGAMYGVVMGYALDHATPDEQAALRRWFTTMAER